MLTTNSSNDEEEEGVFIPEEFEELELIWCNLADILWDIFCQNGNKINRLCKTRIIEPIV